MNNDGYKEVDFGKYCQLCKYFKNLESDDPCHECLNEPQNMYSHKPVNFEEA